MKKAIILVIIGMTTNLSWGQRGVREKVIGEFVFIASLQGTWDKYKDPTKAQFVGNNKLLNSYFGGFSKELRTLGADLNSTAELFFKVDTLGKVDSVILV